MRRILPFLAVAAAAVPGPSPVDAQESRAPFTIAETGEGFGRIQEAVDAIIHGRGDGTILIAPGVYRQCLVQFGGHIIYRAVRPGSAVFEGEACEGKAAFVLRGEGSAVDGIVFRGIRVPDGNGAGIRTEIGDLSVSNSMFLDSQEGILGGVDGAQRVTIDHSSFAGLGQCDETPDCAHSVYLGSKGKVVITHSRFERGRGGHYVKLRVPEVEIRDNSFDDSAGHDTNYMIDLPEGATGLIARNVFVQGPDKENWSGLIVVAAEQRKFSSAGLTVVDNDARKAPGQDKVPAFVATAARDAVRMENNRLGPGIKPFEQR